MSEKERERERACELSRSPGFLIGLLSFARYGTSSV